MKWFVIISLFLASCQPSEIVMVYPTRVTLTDVQPKYRYGKHLFALIYTSERGVNYLVWAFDTTTHVRGEVYWVLVK